MDGRDNTGPICCVKTDSEGRAQVAVLRFVKNRCGRQHCQSQVVNVEVMRDVVTELIQEWSNMRNAILASSKEYLQWVHVPEQEISALDRKRSEAQTQLANMSSQLEVMQHFVGVDMIEVPASRIPGYESAYFRLLQSLEQAHPLVDAIVQRVSDLAIPVRIAVVEKPQQYNNNHFHNNIQNFIQESKSRGYYIHDGSTVQIRDEEMFNGFFGMIWGYNYTPSELDTRQLHANQEGSRHETKMSANANVFTPGQQWTPKIRRQTVDRKFADEKLQGMAMQASSHRNTALPVEIEPNMGKTSDSHAELTASSSVTPAAKRSETQKEATASTSATPAFAKYIPPHRFRSMTAGHQPSLLSQEVFPSSTMTGPAVHEVKG